MTQRFAQGKLILVNDPIEVSADTSLSLPETQTLSLPSTGQTASTKFSANFPSQLRHRYRELLFSQHFDGSRFHNWALNRL